MGRFAALIVLGLIIAVLALASTLTCEYAKGAGIRDMLAEKAQAKDIAATISGAYVKQLQQDPSLNGRFQIRDFMSGSALVTITPTAAGEYEIHTVAFYRNAREELRLRVSELQSGYPVVKESA
jgi:hypothetical protein